MKVRTLTAVAAIALSATAAAAQDAYRDFGANGLEFGDGLDRLDGDFSTQAVTVGLRYKLGL